jgi:hypothetical protein
MCFCLHVDYSHNMWILQCVYLHHNISSSAAVDVNFNFQLFQPMQWLPLICPLTMLSAFPTHVFLSVTTVCITLLSSLSKLRQAVTFLTHIWGSAHFEFSLEWQSSWQVLYGFPQYFRIHAGIVCQISPWLLPYNLLFTYNSIIWCCPVRTAGSVVK